MAISISKGVYHMGKATIAVLGVAVSAAFIYYCIDTKKDQIALKCNLKETVQKITGAQTEVTDEPIEEVTESENETGVTAPKPEKPAVVFEKSDPAFGVTVGEPINVVGMFAPDAKKGSLIHFIDELCSQHTCLNDLRYSEDIKNVAWDQGMIRLIQFMMEEHIQDGSIYVNSNILHIEGTLKDQAERKRLNEIIAQLKQEGLEVEDKSKFAEKSTPKPIEQSTQITTTNSAEKTKTSHIVEEEPAAKKENVKTETPNIEEVSVTQVVKQEKKAVAQPEESAEQKVPKEVHTPEKVVQQENSANVSADEDMATLQRELVTQFEDKLNRLTEAGQKLLDRIAARLQQEGVGKIEIKVYVHQGEDKLVNMIIAQKRANILKNSLRRRGFHNIVANGTGLAEGTDRIEIIPVK